MGEYLLNFHPGANHDIEKYLEANGFEIIEARMTDVIRKTYFYMDAQIKEYHIHKPLAKRSGTAPPTRCSTPPMPSPIPLPSGIPLSPGCPDAGHCPGQRPHHPSHL